MKKAENFKSKEIKKEIEPYTKNGWKKYLQFEDTKIEGYRFHQNKRPISVNNIDINKMVVSNKLPFGKQVFKYFMGYKDSEKTRPLCILHP